jgi:hypothetical protein
MAAQDPGVPLRLCDGTVVWLRSTEPNAPAERAEIVAELRGGRDVGRAGYRRVYGLRAVLTLTIVEDLWPSGLARELVSSIGAVAAAAGIATFLVRVSVCEDRLLELLVDELGGRSRREGTYVDVDLDAAPHAPRRG